MDVQQKKISAFVDDNIKEFVKKLPSYVRKMDKFSKEEKTNSDNELILVTMDVTSLYTNIPNREGIVSVIKTHELNYNSRVSIKSIMNLLTAVLRMNNFNFNGKNYLQVGGTAMGTRLTPSYVNIFMGRLEQTILKTLETKGLKPTLYL